MKIAKRYLALVLSFALFLALPLAFTQEAAAASKGTKILQPSLKIMSSSSEGESSTSVTAYVYNNKGLMSAKVYQDGSQTAFAYNKSGYKTMEAALDSKGRVCDQTNYEVKKGKVKSISNYDIDGTQVSLYSFIRNSYKSGKLSQELYATADGSYSSVTTYRKDGTCSKSVSTMKDAQEIEVYDKYGNITSNTYTSKSGDYSYTRLITYKNTYKSGKLVKKVWTSATTSSYSNTPYVTTGLAVYTYKKDKLVKVVSATSYPGDEWDPAYTIGNTTIYAYTKGDLLKSSSSTTVETTGAESKVTYASTTAYQYKKVAVNKKCVDAVKKAMEEYSYKAYLPGARA